MKYCNNCGKELNDNAVFCPGCGTKYVAPQQTQGSLDPVSQESQESQQTYQAPQYQQAPQQTYQAPQYQQTPQQTYQAPQHANGDSDSVGWTLLGVFLSGIAAILYFLWRKKKPMACEKMAFGVMIATLISAVAALLYIVIMVVAFGGLIGGMYYYY